MHLCPVVAAITAQSSVGVARVEAVSPEVLDAQLAALADDMPPPPSRRACSAARAPWPWWRAGSTSCARVGRSRWWSIRCWAPARSAAFADDAVLRAYRELLLPRATLLTPNEREARRLVGLAKDYLFPQTVTGIMTPPARRPPNASTSPAARRSRATCREVSSTAHQS